MSKNIDYNARYVTDFKAFAKKWNITKCKTKNIYTRDKNPEKFGAFTKKDGSFIGDGKKQRVGEFDVTINDKDVTVELAFNWVTDPKTHKKTRHYIRWPLTQWAKEQHEENEDEFYDEDLSDSECEDEMEDEL